MDILANVYHKKIAENEKNIRFWEEYLRNLKSLDFSVYSDKLKVPVLVPIGSKILFRGEIKHTNEVTVSLGADYMVKCSLKQADVLRQHRIKCAESQLQEFQKERDYLVGQISFSKQSVFEDQGQDIVEFHSEDDDKAWRQQHRDRVRQWKQQKKTEKATNKDGITDEELWNRLEELELQEELQMELYKDDNQLAKEGTEQFIEKEDVGGGNKTNKDKGDDQLEIVNKKSASYTSKLEPKEMTKHEDCITDKKVKFKEPHSVKPAAQAQVELLQKVIDKQVELEVKLLEIRSKNRSNSKTEQDLIAKLDELDDLEELEDEMDRIEDLIETEDSHEQSEGEDEDTSSISQLSDLKRRVSFADQDESETLEITFHHSDIEPEHEPYSHQKGIQKPSDIYKAFSHLFFETKSILKKTKYQDKNFDTQSKEEKEMELMEESAKENRTIEVKDIVEKVDDGSKKLMVNEEKRPVSLFKQRRQQQSRRS